MGAAASWGYRLEYITTKIWKQLNQVSMVKIFLGLATGSRYKEDNCSVVVLAKVTWYRLSCTILVSSAPNSKYSLFHILALSLSDTLEFIGGLGDENNWDGTKGLMGCISPDKKGWAASKGPCTMQYVGSLSMSKLKRWTNPQCKWGTIRLKKWTNSQLKQWTNPQK